MNPDSVTRPLLAEKTRQEDLDKLRYPLLVSPKLDGIRAIAHPKYGGPVTRKLKKVPNHYIFEELCDPRYYGLDGELVCRRDDGSLATFNEIQSAVMSHNGTPLWEYWVFDFTNTDEPYKDRLKHLTEVVQELDDPRIKLLAQTRVNDSNQLIKVAQQFIASGHEGAIMRDPYGPYKEGRSTLRQQWLLKYKQFADATGLIIDIEPMQHNENTAEVDELGYTKRSHEKDGMRTSDSMMGNLVLHTEWGELRIGSGFDFASRELIWTNRQEYIGRHVDFRYQTFGMQDKPRFPTFLRFREEFDL